MAGIFEPQTLQGSSMAGESFVKAPSEKISSRAISDIAKTATNIYGTVQVNKAAGRIGEIQSSFLDELSQNRDDISEIETLKESNPAEYSSYQSAQSRIKTLQEAVNARKLNPSEAVSRIEAEKRKAMAAAPMFADRIRGLSGDRGATFDTETSQLIKERNDFREIVVKMGGNPDNDSHMLAARRIQASEAEAKHLGSLTKIEGVKASRVAQEAVNAQIAMQESIIMGQIEDAGGFDKLSPEQTSEIITSIQRFKGPNASNIVSNMIDGMPNVDIGLVPPQVLERMEARIAGAADTLEKQLNGTIPKDIFANRLTLEEDTVMVNLQKTNPNLFNNLVLLSKVPPNTIPQRGFAEVVSQGMLYYAKESGLNNLNNLTKSGMKANGIDDPVEIQKNVASNLSSIREFLEKNPNEVDPGFAKASIQTVNTQMEAMAAAPREFTPKLFDEMLSTISSDQFKKVSENLDPGQYEQFLDNSKTMVQSYIAENMAPDMSRELDKRIFVGEVIGGSLTSPKLRDIVTPTVTEGGLIRFQPNSGLTLPASVKKAEIEAQRLTKMYSNRSASIVRATKSLGGITDEDVSQKDLTLALFQEAFSGIGESFQTSPDEVDTKTPLRESIKPILSRDK